MRDVISLYPRFLVFSAIMAAFLAAVAVLPGANATAISNPVQTSATETSDRAQADECRIDQHAYAPTCTMRGRTVRVIKF
jgi:hypothetical protein